MKKKKLKAWIQDMILISVIGKVGFLCMLYDLNLSLVTFMVLTYVTVSLILEVYLLGRYEIRPSLLIGKEQ